MLILGFTGEKGSGKDTAGNYLVEKYGFERMAFADALKQVCKIVFDLTDKQLNDASRKEQVDERWEVSPRHLMQVVGTELFRDKLTEAFPHLKGNIWVSIIKQKLLKTKNKKVVLTDVRFENEAELLHNFGGKLIRIQRNNIIKKKDPHSSETNQLEVNQTLQNTTSKEELYAQLDILVNNLVIEYEKQD
jgi:dephospho-CoA kinase